ncbi:hypothetical protein M406DRAFT_42669 [Cryphonectria parasitica EP155]|uniref:NmrA-like family domain-containing protein 1 n=1 Tax=Cryphonectria parasitica (strain ATCC 38755 / EP155) TaxID=660469 RepID=A0A9P4Y104_CRYP1|nr:uncharacterized protein M406DRAFT_42669 [Cryphonectria parasitica EP155]KAF3764519.1 hypothetical protein M406DRAFT_42669 [Cryphonectria parasitica EP155]
MSSKKIITIFGATGNQGGSVVRIFLNDPKLKNDWAVRGVSRNAESDSAKKLTALGVEMVSADLNDKASLVRAMKGAYAIFAVTNYWEKMDMQLDIDQGKNLADAAKENGVQHYVWSSLLNINKLTNGKLPHVYHFDSKAMVEDYVREIGLPATFVMPGFFMSNLPGGMFRATPPDNEWTLALPMPETAPIPLFDPEDMGAWVKAILLRRDGPGMLGRRVYAATAYLTPAEIVAQFREVFTEAGRGARFVSTPHGDFLEGLKGRGMPEFAAEETLENMRLIDEGGYYGGASLEESHAILEDKLTTWKEHMKKAKAFADLK